MTVVKKEHPYLEEEYYVVSFVNGLKDEIKCLLRPLRPSLTEAYWLAKDYVKELQYKKNNKFPSTGHPKPNQYQHQGRIQVKPEKGEMVKNRHSPHK